MQSKKARITHFKRSLQHPYDVSFSFSGKKLSVNKLYAAREETATKCDVFGSWIGSGCGFGQCDTQLEFRTLADVNKAKAIANKIAKKYEIKLEVRVKKYTRKQLLELYDLTEKDVK